MMNDENKNVCYKNVTLEKIKRLGGIYIENIQEGFDSYNFSYLEGTKDEIQKEIKRLQEQNGIAYSFVDFYYGRLSNKEKEKVKQHLEEPYLKILNKYEDLNDVTYLLLEEEILCLTSELNAKEILFSTYYFCKYPCTIWGNYQLKYPVFTNK